MRLTIKIFKQFQLNLIFFSKHYCEYTSGHMWITWIRAVVHQIKVKVIDLPKDSIALIFNGLKVAFAKWIIALREVTKPFTKFKMQSTASLPSKSIPRVMMSLQLVRVVRA